MNAAQEDGKHFALKTLLFVLALIGPVIAAETPKEKEKTKEELVFPIPEMKLTNGRVWKNVTVVRYDKETIVLKSSAGVGPLSYSLIPEPTRGLMLAARDTARAAGKSNTPGVAVEMANFHGQVFVVTRGAGSYKLGNTMVYVLPPDAAAQFESSGIYTFDFTLPPAMATARTDADGNFKFTIEARKPFVIFAQSHRLAGGEQEFYEWVVKNSGDAPENKIVLSNDSMKSKWSRAKIAP